MARTTLLACLVLMLGLEHSPAAIVGTLDIAALQAGVVRITATPSGEPQKVGTGFIVRLERDVVYIVTAAHVVSGDAQPKVQFFAQQDVSAQATVKHSEGGDEVTGLALLVVRGKDNLPSGLTALTLTSAPRMSGNDEIILIGHPRGAGDWAILRGSIASRQGRYVVVDANIDEGNSGGPIIQNGEVVGIVGGVTRYGRGVTSGSVREYLEGHGISSQEAPASVAKVQPTPSIPITPEKPIAARGREIIGKDGAPMVLIPAGPYIIDNGGVRTAYYGELSLHPNPINIYVHEFYIDSRPVSVEQYRLFAVRVSRREPVSSESPKTSTSPADPIFEKTWYEAQDYCQWAGKRLPTEDEWEKGHHDEGHHMTWNIEEWTASSFSPDRNIRQDRLSDNQKVIRGMIDVDRQWSSFGRRSAPTKIGLQNVGFRCVQDGPN